MSAFDEMHPRDQREIIDGVKDYVLDGARDRKEAAERRHGELLDLANLALDALAAGARAFAEALDRRPRRR